MRGAHHNHVADHERRGVEPDVAAVRVDLLVEVFLQVHDAVVAERVDGNAGLRVERDHAIAGGHVEDALVCAVRARPPRHAATGSLASARTAARAFVLAVQPLHFARCGIERDHRAARARRRVQGVVHVERGCGIQRVGARAEKIRAQAPRNAQILEVVLVDLVQGRVALARKVAAVGRPLLGATTRCGRRLRRAQGRAKQAPEHESAGGDPKFTHAGSPHG